MEEIASDFWLIAVHRGFPIGTCRTRLLSLIYMGQKPSEATEVVEFNHTVSFCKWLMKMQFSFIDGNS